MNRLWLQYVNSVGRILRQLRRGRRLAVPAGHAPDLGEEEREWEQCAKLLDALLMPSDEYACLKFRQQNALSYYRDGEVGVAAYELSLALRRACNLRRLYG